MTYPGFELCGSLAAEIARNVSAFAQRMKTLHAATQRVVVRLDRLESKAHRGQARRDGRTARQYRAHKRALGRAERALRRNS